ncbi:MAG: glycoside hydrolase family 9 protein [Lachnospiraceae bacterium]|nr:glycoside hydrolase family 9 protein [Lachnospiraceae bacterium]
MKGHKKTTLLLALLLVCSCMGCANWQEPENLSSHNALTPMETTPIVDYVVPRQTANILVNRLGYQSDSRKEAAIKGKNLPETFRVVRAEDGQLVYNGTIETITYNADMGIYTGVAVFDELVEPGSYYVECDIVGRSFDFLVADDLYAQLFGEVYQEALTKCENGTLSLSGAVALLSAYEWYADIFPDANGDQVPDVLTALTQWMEKYEEGAEDTQQALRAAFFAKFSYLYQNYNRRYATSCLQRASTLFGQTQNTLQKDADCFFALTELYRATGLRTYDSQIKEYRLFFENNSSYPEERMYLYGMMTYLATRQKVDADFCEILIKQVRGRGEEIAGRYEEIVHPITARNNGAEDVLQRTEELLLSNYVMSSYQYYNIDKDFLNYLCGRNLESVCFYQEEESHEGYLLLLAQLTAENL